MVDYLDNFYKGGYNSFSPEYGNFSGYKPAENFTGYKMDFSTIGTALDARTADQVKEISKHLNTGIKNFEIATHSADVMDAMPKEQFEEIHRMSKLLKVEPTMHAPMIDPTGITEQGWSEMNQDIAKRQLLHAIERGQRSLPNGNLVVTMHASTVGLPQANLKMKEGGEEKTKSMLIVGPGGKIGQLKDERRYFPEIEGEKFTGEHIKFDAKAELERINKKGWVDSLQQISQQVYFATRDSHINPIKNKISPEERIEIEKLGIDHPMYKEYKKQYLGDFNYEESHLQGAYNGLKNLFNTAYENADEKQKKELGKYANEMAKKIKEYDNLGKNPDKIEQFAEDIQKGVEIMKNVNANLYKPLEEFAREKSAESFGDIAFESYKKFKNNSPIISIENHPAGQSLLTTGEDLKVVVEQARENFVNKATQELGMSKSEAKKQAEKLIGVTWDVGHINMLRKYGYDNKDIIKETEKVAKLVKHVHLSDNFGFEHTELPMGMGNVPIKEIMEKLGKEGFKGKKVVEALSWWQHFSNQGVNSAIIPTMQAFGSPVFSGSYGGPGWETSHGMMGSYMGFPTAYMPEKHFSMYGSGFSSLPQELGGQIPGSNSRFSGTPMA